MSVKSATTKRFRRTKTAALITVSLIAICGLIAAITPWPSAMLIRAVFKQGGEATATEMSKHIPNVDLTESLNLQYGTHGDFSTLNVFSPADTDAALPTVFWIHGGAWISGSKHDVNPYLRILASEGYTAVGMNYPLGPESNAPAALDELNNALKYLLDNAESLKIDPNQIVFAGDSAGAQLASQLATAVTNDDYAYIQDITPAINKNQLKAVILNCGVYDLAALQQLTGILGWGLKTAMWAYTGSKSWAVNHQGSLMSTINWVTEDFPATYISGGNSDGLTWLQSIPMAKELDEKGVEIHSLFWPANHQPGLPHEYQFHLDTVEAQRALKETIQFLASHTTK